MTKAKPDEVEMIKIISRDTIKPSSPTPHPNRNFNLSFFDQIMPDNIYPSLIIFYPFLDHRVNYNDLLKSSLSETLTLFYPLAGKIMKNELFVDCTGDNGVEFLEAKVLSRLSYILKHPNTTLLSELLPTKTVSVEEAAASGRPLLVQTNLFDCGGIAIGVSMSHKIADASTLSLFIKAWAATARGAGHTVVPDIGIIASRFPAISFPISSAPAPADQPAAASCICKTRRYVFDAKSITALRAKARSASMLRPSRVESVLGHILLSMMRSNLGHTRTSCGLMQSMNLRKRINPPMSENSFGNFVGYFAAEVDKEDEVELHELVNNMRRGLEHATETYVKEIEGEGRFMAICEAKKEFMSLSAKYGEDLFKISSWCRFSLYENADFGWGRPVWLSLNDLKMKNVVMLTDTRDGDGIEVLLTLLEKDVAVLETNQEFLEFASLNPSVL